MAIATLAAYKAKTLAPYQVAQVAKVGQSGFTALRLFNSYWDKAFNAGVAPTTAAACDRTLAGALGQLNSSGVQRLIQSHISMPTAGYLLLCDRLSHQGGLSGTDTSPQTTNLPTAAFTRYTSGAGVFAFVEIHASIGTSAATASVSYTNQAGTAGQTSPAFVIGSSTAYNTIGRLIPIPLAVGDSGFRSVESLALSASTGSAGAFGIVLAKPLLAIPYPVGGADMLADGIWNLGAQMPQVLDDACLWWVASAMTQLGPLHASLFLAEE